MNRTIILYPSDLTDNANDYLSRWFSEHYAHYLEVYTDSRNRQKIKWCFTGVCKMPMYITPHGFSIKNISFDSKTIEFEIYSKIQEYILNIPEKINP